MRQLPLTRRRILWTLGVGLGGLLIGGKGGGAWGTLLGPIWGAGIGYGFGSIFDKKRVAEPIIAYWALTLALVGLFFGLLIGAGLQPTPSVVQHAMAGALGTVAGGLVGLLVGTTQERKLRRRSQGSPSDAVP